jgi:hypothetical protein
LTNGASEPRFGTLPLVRALVTLGADPAAGR